MPLILSTGDAEVSRQTHCCLSVLLMLPNNNSCEDKTGPL